MEEALLLIIALLCNALLAGPKRLLDRLGISYMLHKPAGLLRTLERKLNRDHRSAKERQMRGAVVVLAAFIAALILGLIAHAVLSATSQFGAILLLVFFLPVRPSWDIAAMIRRALADSKLVAAQNALAGTLWRHHARLDAHGVARAAIELLAVQFAEKIIAPVLWYMIAGFPGLFFCAAVTVMHETLAVSGGDFGKPAKSVYRFIQWLPSRLAACMWIAASLFSASENIKHTAQTIWARMSRQTPQGLQLACAATVMQLSLGGPPSVYAEEWIGSGSAKLTANHIKTAQYLFVVKHLLLVMVLGLLI